MPATNERLWGLLHLCAEIQCRKRKTVKAHQTVWKWKETKQFRGEIVAEAVNGQTLSPIKLGVSGKGRFMQMLCFRMKACVLVVHCEITNIVFVTTKLSSPPPDSHMTVISENSLHSG